MEPGLQMIKEVSLQPLQQVYRSIAAFIPQILGAFALLLVGWIVALVFRKVTGKLLRALGLDVLAERFGVVNVLTRADIRKRPSELLGYGVYWLVLFSALVGTFNALGLEVASLLLHTIVLYIPNIFVALILLVLGFVASRAVDTMVTATATAFNLPAPDAWGRGGQGLILFITSVMVLNELGITTRLVSLSFVVLVGVTASAAMLACGLGSKDVIAHVTAGQCLRQTLHPGDVIQYAEHEGTLQEVGMTHVILATEQGVVTIPNAVLLQTTVVKRSCAAAQAPGESPDVSEATEAGS
jgi:small-conductance mechanosensitive channel